MDFPIEDATDPETAADDSVLAVLAVFAADGWTSNHSSEPNGEIRCGDCDNVRPAGQWAVRARHRVEGSSDPADMQALYGLVCPVCGERGALLLSYGPSASDQDQQVLLAIREGDTVADPMAADPD